MITLNRSIAAVLRRFALQLLVAVVVATWGTSVAFADTSLTVVPPTQSVQPGAHFGLDVYVASDEPTRGLQLGLRYDPGLVQVDSVSEGEYYRDWALANEAQSKAVIPFVPDPGRHHTSTGAIILIGGSPYDGPTGVGSIIHVALTALNVASGETSIEYENVVVSNAYSVPVQDVRGTSGVVHVGAGPVVTTPREIALPYSPPRTPVAPPGILVPPPDQPLPQVDVSGISETMSPKVYFTNVFFPNVPVFAGFTALGLIAASVVYRVILRLMDGPKKR